MGKSNYNSKLGQRKFYGFMLVVILIILALLHKFYPGNSEVASSGLQPIREYVSNTTGLPIGIYSGAISKISAKSITLSNGDKSKDFGISEQNPAKFVNANGKTIEPKAGDKVTQLYLVELPSKERFVTRVIIDTSGK